MPLPHLLPCTGEDIHCVYSGPTLCPPVQCTVQRGRAGHSQAESWVRLAECSCGVTSLINNIIGEQVAFHTNHKTKFYTYNENLL